MVFNKEKTRYNPEKLVEDLQTEEGYNFASDYVYEIAKREYQKIKTKFYKLGETVLEDVFQEAVMATITNVRKGKLEDPLKLAPYFSTIFRNFCVNIVRKKASREKKGFVIVPLDAGILPELGEEAYDAVAKALAKEEKENKTIELLELTFKKCLRLFRLRVIELMSYEQIAKIEKMSSEGTARSILSQCKSKIRRGFKEG